MLARLERMEEISKSLQMDALPESEKSGKIQSTNPARHEKGDIGYMINIGCPVFLDEDTANCQMVARYNRSCATVVIANHMPKNGVTD